MQPTHLLTLITFPTKAKWQVFQPPSPLSLFCLNHSCPPIPALCIMSLLHALVARETVVLAEHDASTGGQSYAQATQTILSKLPPNDSRLTFSAGEILIHYQKTNGVVALVVSDDELGRKLPFAFLSELHKRFTTTYNANEIADAPAYGMAAFAPEMGKLMTHFVESPPNDPVKAAQAELANVKDIMVRNIDAVLSRGERIELLVDKTDNMSTQARAFRKRSTALRRKMWWRNVKVMGMIGFSAFVLFYIVLAQFCGASLTHCSS